MKLIATVLWGIFTCIPRAYDRFIVMSIKKSMLQSCGEKVTIGRGSNFTWSNVVIGDEVTVGINALFLSTRAKIIIGNHVIFGPNVTLITGDHRIDIVGCHINSVTDNEKLPENDKDIIIEGDNWIGANVIILKGVKIGEGAVVAAGSVVTKEVPKYTIWAGVPARQIGLRFDEEGIKRHNKILRKEQKK